MFLVKNDITYKITKYKPSSMSHMVDSLIGKNKT